MDNSIMQTENKVREIRRASGISQALLAKRSGIHAARISVIERGLAIVVSERDKARIADALGVSVEGAFPPCPPDDVQT